MPEVESGRTGHRPAVSSADAVGVSFAPRISNRGRALAALCVALAAGLGACGDAAGEVSTPRNAKEASTPAEPGLQGLWRLEAPGEAEGTVLRLEGGDWDLLRPCAIVGGTWAARAGLFLGHRDSSKARTIPGCAEAQRSDPGWWDRIVAYQPTETGWSLLDKSGAPVAALAGGASPPAYEARGRHYLEAGGDFYPDREERARLNAAVVAPLPAGVRAPSEAELLGRWEPDFERDDWCNQPYIEFNPDGRWAGHTSGTPTRGRWVLGEDGLALGTASPDESGPCPFLGGYPAPNTEGSHVDVWLLRLGRLGLDGNELVFYDAGGEELQRIHRASAPPKGDDIDHDGLADSSEDGYVDRWTATKKRGSPND